MLVDFIIIGAQKSATTRLAQQLRGHPQVSFCSRKEPHFFSKVPDWSARIEEYHQLYRTNPGCIYGEASTTYTFLPLFPHVPEVLHTYNPELKLIYVVRDPIERMKSSYMHTFAKGNVRLPINRAVLEDPYFLNVSRYGMQIRWYLEHFPPEQLLVLTFEEVVGEAESTWEKVCRFLGVIRSEPVGPDVGVANASTEFRWVRQFPGKRTLTRAVGRVPLLRRVNPPSFLLNSWKERPELTRQTHEILLRLLEDDIRFVEDYLAIDLNRWRRHPSWDSAIS